MLATGKYIEPIIVPKIPGASNCSIPVCRHCIRGKGAIKSLQSMFTTPNPSHTDVIKMIIYAQEATSVQIIISVKRKIVFSILKGGKTLKRYTVEVQYLLTTRLH